MRFCDCLSLWAPRAAGRKKPRFTKNPGPSFTGLPILSLYSSNDFSRPLSLLVMAGIAFAAVSHAGALGLPWGVGSGDCLSVLGALDAQNTILAPFRRGKDDVPGGRASRRALGRAPVFLTCLDVFAFSRLGARGIMLPVDCAWGVSRAHVVVAKSNFIESRLAHGRQAALPLRPALGGTYLGHPTPHQKTTLRTPTTSEVDCQCRVQKCRRSMHQLRPGLFMTAVHTRCTTAPGSTAAAAPHPGIVPAAASATAPHPGTVAAGAWGCTVLPRYT